MECYKTLRSLLKPSCTIQDKMDPEQQYSTSQCFSACVVQQRGCLCAHEDRDGKNSTSVNNKTSEPRLTQEVHFLDASLQTAEPNHTQPCGKCGHVRKVTDTMLIARPSNLTRVRPRPTKSRPLKPKPCNGSGVQVPNAEVARGDSCQRSGKSGLNLSKSQSMPRVVVGLSLPSKFRLDHPYSRSDPLECSCSSTAHEHTMVIRNRPQMTTAQVPPPNSNTSTTPFLNTFSQKDKDIYKVKSKKNSYLCKVLRHAPHIGHATVKPFIRSLPTKHYTKLVYPPLSETKSDTNLQSEQDILDSRGKRQVYRNKCIVRLPKPSLLEEERIYPNTQEELQSSMSSEQENHVLVANPDEPNPRCVRLLRHTNPGSGINMFAQDQIRTCSLQHPDKEIGSEPYIAYVEEINRPTQTSIKQDTQDEPGTFPAEYTNPALKPNHGEQSKTSIHPANHVDLGISTVSIKQENEVCMFLLTNADPETSTNEQVKTENSSETVANPFTIEDEPVDLNTGPNSKTRESPQGSTTCTESVIKMEEPPDSSISDQNTKSTPSCERRTKRQANTQLLDKSNKSLTLDKQPYIFPDKSTDLNTETIPLDEQDKVHEVGKESSEKVQTKLYTPDQFIDRPISGPVEIGVKIHTKSSGNICTSNEGERPKSSQTQTKLYTPVTLAEQDKVVGKESSEKIPTQIKLHTPISTSPDIGHRPISGPVEIGVKIHTKSSGNTCTSNEGERPKSSQISVKIDRSQNELLCIHKGKPFKGKMVDGVLKLLEPLTVDGDINNQDLPKILKDNTDMDTSKGSCEKCDKRLDPEMPGRRKRRKRKFGKSNEYGVSVLGKNPVVQITGEIEWREPSGKKQVYHGLDNMDNVDIAMDVEIQNNGSDEEGSQSENKDLLSVSPNVSCNETNNDKHDMCIEDEDYNDFGNLTEAIGSEYPDFDGPLILEVFEGTDSEETDSAESMDDW